MPVLSPAQKERLLTKMRARQFNCPNKCSPLGTSGEIGDVVGIPVVEHGVPSGLILGNQFLPVIPIVCKGCGAVAWFSTAGLVDLNE